jgi:hypothetical protein
MTSLLQSFGLCQRSTYSQTLVKQAGSAAEFLGATGNRGAIRHSKIHRTSPLIHKKNSKNMVAAHGPRTALREACWSLKSGKRQVGERVILGRRRARRRKWQIETEQYRVREIDDGKPIRNNFG